MSKGKDINLADLLDPEEVKKVERAMRKRPSGLSADAVSAPNIEDTYG